MKRKSILFSLMLMLAVFVGTTTFAQISTNVWPTTHPSNLAKADSIYFCQYTDTIFPLELGYDVRGLNLAPSYGTWSHIASYSDGEAGQTVYNKDVKVSKVAAGNVFNVLNIPGAHLFQYQSLSEQCGLAQNDVLWVYIFVLPSYPSGKAYGDTVVCKKAGEVDLTGKNPLYSFVHKELFNKADIDITTTDVFAPGKHDQNVLLDTTYEFTFKATPRAGSGALNPKRGFKNCLVNFKFEYNLKIKDDNKPEGRVGFICSTLDNHKTDPIYKIPVDGVLGYSNAFTPDSVQKLDKVVGLKYKLPNGDEFDYALVTVPYKDCDGNNATYTDTIVFLDKDISNNERESNKVGPICIEGGGLDALDNFIPAASASTVHTWEYWGITGATKVTGSPAADIFVNSLNVDKALMDPGTEYYFRYYFDKTGNILSDCFEGSYGQLILSGIHRFVPKDYRVQLCTKDGNSPPKGIINFELFTGLKGADWKTLSAVAVADPSSVEVSGYGVHKYFYEYPNITGCGGGKGVFYVKMSDKTAIASEFTELFCTKRHGEVINVNELIGYYGGGTWSLDDSNQGASVDCTAEFDPATGQFKLTEAKKKFAAVTNSATTIEFTFTLDKPTCVGTGNQKVTLTVKIVSDII